MKIENEKYEQQLKKAENVMTILAQKHGITTEQFLENIDILKKYSLEDISCALAHYCFRNGPVEDMHAEGKLSQSDMKVLNKFCNDKIFTFLTMMRNNEIGRLESIIDFGVKCGYNWDKPEYRED